jgi:hypothetical protein
MKRNRSTFFVACALLVNLLLMFTVNRQGIPAAFASPVIFCLTWLAFNLLCFFIYLQLRPK